MLADLPPREVFYLKSVSLANVVQEALRESEKLLRLLDELVVQCTQYSLSHYIGLVMLMHELGHLKSLVLYLTKLWKSSSIIKSNASQHDRRRVNYMLIMCFDVLIESKTAMSHFEADSLQVSLTDAMPAYLDEGMSGDCILPLLVVEKMTAYLCSIGKVSQKLDILPEKSEEVVHMERLCHWLVGGKMELDQNPSAANKSPVSKTQENVIENVQENFSESDYDSICPFDDEEESNFVDDETFYGSNLKKPKLIRDFISYLKGPVEGDDAVIKAELALSALEATIRQTASQNACSEKNVKEWALELVQVLVHFKLNHSSEKFGMYRFKSLVALVVASKTDVPLYLVHELWHNIALSIGDRLELLSVLATATRELSEAADSTLPNELKRDEKVMFNSSTDLEPTPEKNLCISKTKYYHPYSRQLKARVSHKNPLHSTLSLWFKPLVQGFWLTKLSWFREELRNPIRDHSLTPSSLLGSLSLYDNVEQKAVKKLRPFTLLLLTKWIASLMLILHAVGPFDPHLVENGKLVAEVVQWYCCFASQTAVDSDGIYGEVQLMDHPQFKNTILLVLWTCMNLADTNKALLERDEWIPFGLLPSITGHLIYGGLDGLLDWLTSHTMLRDNQDGHRSMATRIVSLLKKRVDEVYPLPTDILSR